MEKQEAINVLIQVAGLAQSKGILSLQDAVIVLKAINELKEEDQQEEETE